MKTRTILKVVFLVSFLAVFAGCVQTKETKKEAKLAPVQAEKEKMRLNFSPQQETNYKVVMESGKDYSFVQPSVNKTKDRHTKWRNEMIFAQKIEKVDQQGNATANITIKQLKYLSQDADNKVIEFDSTAESGKSDPLSAIIGQSYKIKITPSGKVEVIDAQTAREAVKGKGSAKKIADRLLSNEEIGNRHQVLALNDAEKGSCKKGDKWSTVAASPPGMLRQKSFEKVYTLADIQNQNGSSIATVTMEAVPSSKRAASAVEGESASGFIANMFDEKDNYTGKMVLNLTTGEIDSLQETLKVEWIAVEPSEEQKSDKGPDQLTMGFSNLYSIEKVK